MLYVPVKKCLVILGHTLALSSTKDNVLSSMTKHSAFDEARTLKGPRTVLMKNCP